MRVFLLRWLIATGTVVLQQERQLTHTEPNLANSVADPDSGFVDSESDSGSWNIKYHPKIGVKDKKLSFWSEENRNTFLNQSRNVIFKCKQSLVAKNLSMLLDPNPTSMIRIPLMSQAVHTMEYCRISVGDPWHFGAVPLTNGSGSNYGSYSFL